MVDPAKKFSIADFELLAEIGKGAYGEVVLARRREDQLQVAIKVLGKSFLAREKKQYQVLIEKEVLMRLDHVGVVRLVNSFQDANNLYFAIEYCESGDFRAYLDKNCKIKLL